jgi:primosomal protein N' (replication factor Y)
VFRYCRVALDSPVRTLDRPLDYEIPERMLGRVDVGSVVRVVVHGRGMRGFVTELLDAPAVARTRPLSRLVSPTPVFTTDEIGLARWVARRYIVPAGLVLHDAVPGRFSVSGDGGEQPLPPRTNRPAWMKPSSSDRVCLLPPCADAEREAIAYLVGEVAARGGRSLVICPRTDVAETVASAIEGATVAHGEDRPADRAGAWAAARDGRTSVVVGTRSALFVPLPDVALVAVVGAHDTSLKSERAPRVYAPVAAAERARRAGARFVLSSGAPPVELAYGTDWQGAKRPDLRPEVVRPREGPVTERLLDVVRSSIERGEDAIIFAGRVGDALRVRCRDCGWTPVCAEDGTPLQTRGRAIYCRVCGSTRCAPDVCASCGGHLSERGWGHERIARELERAGVGAPVVRMVRGEIQIDRPHPAAIVGTTAAAHAIGRAGGVCVADLDQLLMRADFRASERALQTLHELAAILAPGGRFLVQTREPEHHAVQSFVRQSYRFFFDREIAIRRETGYPPFGVVVRVETGAVEDLRGALGDVAVVVGSLERRGKASALVRGPDLEPMLEPLRSFSRQHPEAKIDVDPVDIL